jgi:hypothetical protein
MLKTVPVTGDKKTGPIGGTYRTGETTMYGSCPSDCPLMKGCKGELPTPDNQVLDVEYMMAEREAVPPGGWAFGYTHTWMRWKDQIPYNEEGKSCINLSATSIEDAQALLDEGRDVVVALPENTPTPKGWARCPQELSDKINCSNCGGAKGPLCARPNRGYPIVFKMKHTKKGDKLGKCYGNFFRVRAVWNRTVETGLVDDPVAVTHFAKNQPHGSRVRHRIAGDFCKED